MVFERIFFISLVSQDLPVAARVLTYDPEPAPHSSLESVVTSMVSLVTNIVGTLMLKVDDALASWASATLLKFVEYYFV